MTFKLRPKREKELYGALVKSSADGIYVISRGRFEYVNPAFERLVGYSEEEIRGPGFDLLSLVHPDDRKLFKEGMDARDGIVEFRIVNRKGETKYVEASTSILPGNQGKIMGIMRETTARRLATRSLQENEEKYRYVVDRASDGIAIIQDSLFKFINPRAAEIGGFPLEELIDTPFSRYLATEDITTLERTLQGEPGPESSPVIVDATVKRKDGTVTNVELSTGRISYQGKPASLVILRDVTERKYASSRGSWPWPTSSRPWFPTALTGRL